MPGTCCRPGARLARRRPRSRRWLQRAFRPAAPTEFARYATVPAEAALRLVLLVAGAVRPAPLRDYVAPAAGDFAAPVRASNWMRVGRSALAVSAPERPPAYSLRWHFAASRSRRCSRLATMRRARPKRRLRTIR